MLKIVRYSATFVAMMVVAAFLLNRRDWSGRDKDANDGVDRGNRVKNHKSSTVPRAVQQTKNLTESSKLDFSKLMQRWEELKVTSLSDREKKAKLCRLIEEMVESGHYEDAKKLSLEIDPGYLRNALIHSLFSHFPKDLDALLAQAKDPAFTGRDRDSVRAGLLENLSDRQGIDKVANYLKSGKLRDEQTTKLLLLGAFSYMDPLYNAGGYLDVDDNGESRIPEDAERQMRCSYILGKFKSLLTDCPEDASSILDGLLDAMDPRMPREAIQILSEYSDRMNKDSATGAAREALKRMFEISPSEALGAVDSLGGKFDMENVIAPGLKIWLNNDSSAVRTWLSGEGKQASKEVFDKVSSDTSDYLAKNGNIDEATKLAMAMRGSEERDKALLKIDEYKSEKFYVEARGDFNASLNSLARHDSDLPPRYIERTLGEWIEKYPDKAAQWTSENWDSLNADKRQFVAAACAIDAAKKGDSIVAGQWLDQITDASERARVKQEMGKRAGGK